MTPAKLYTAKLTPFSPILGKWENGESVGKIGSYHACHNATNSMMASADYLMMPLPTLVEVLAIGGSDTASMITGDDGWRLSHLPHLAIYKQPRAPANLPNDLDKKPHPYRGG